MINLKRQCFVCREYKYWFQVKHRAFVFPKASPLPITSVDAMCNSCFYKTKEAVFNTPEVEQKEEVSQETEELSNNNENNE